MQPSQKLVDYAIRIGINVARRCCLDPDTTISVACEIAVTTAARVETELDSFKLFSSVVKRRLVPQVCAELQVFGPKLTALAQRRYRKIANSKNPHTKREPHEVICHASRPVRINLVDFFDQFSHDPELHQYVLLVISGYTQTELICDFGYTRARIRDLKEKIEHVYGRPSNR